MVEKIEIQQITLVDTHCHINAMVKENFDRLLTVQEFPIAAKIVNEASQAGVTRIINVGTSLIESINCVELAKTFDTCYASVGIHPNDCTSNWRKELLEMKKLWFGATNTYKNYKIVAIGECGIDKHYPSYNIHQQIDAFKAQIEFALEYSLPLIVHTRNAGDETLKTLEEYRKENLRGIIHCFSEDQPFADTALSWGFVLGIGGTLTYPKNTILREIFTKISLEKIILETDAPFLPVQAMRGKQNHPMYIATIAEFLANLRNESFNHVATITTKTACAIFKFNNL